MVVHIHEGVLPQMCMKAHIGGEDILERGHREVWVVEKDPTKYVTVKSYEVQQPGVRWICLCYDKQVANQIAAAFDPETPCSSA